MSRIALCAIHGKHGKFVSNTWLNPDTVSICERPPSPTSARHVRAAVHSLVAKHLAEQGLDVDQVVLCCVGNGVVAVDAAG